MCWKLAAWALEVKNITPYDMLVLSKLGSHADVTTRKCFPSQSRLAKDLNMSRQRVNIAIKNLVKLSLIKCLSNNEYLVLTPCPVIHDDTCTQEIEDLPVNYDDTPVILNDTPVIHDDTSVNYDDTNNKSFNKSFNKDKKTKQKKSYSDDELIQFKEIYPYRKQGTRLVKQSEGEIAPAFEKARRDSSFEEIIGGLERAKEAWDDPQYIPMSTTWLNQKRWKQDIKTDNKPQVMNNGKSNNRPRLSDFAFSASEPSSSRITELEIDRHSPVIDVQSRRIS